MLQHDIRVNNLRHLMDEYHHCNKVQQLVSKFLLLINTGAKI